ncbi:MAG TPA: hypothetical protein VIC33_04860 [Vicinamibacterales bacterium]|jgi:hypothetical protein
MTHARPRALIVITCLAILFAGRPAFADITAFIGATPTPVSRQARGFAVGAGLLVVGFEFEYSSVKEDPINGGPSLKTGMGNILLQTPVPIFGFQPYWTAGAGLYHEGLGTVGITNVGANTGGGVKLSLVGPLRLRIDYRVFTLRGNPPQPHPQRIYAGLNLAF